MTKFRDMKIAITPDQPADEIARELERIGYRRIHTSRNPNAVLASSGGGYGTYLNVTMEQPNATLSDLKKMN